jgi:hypothetical protein
MGSSLGFGARSDGNEYDDEIVFSYIEGYVWMSWPGAVGAVRVGPYQASTEAMRDFLAQCELGERLANGSDRSPSAQSS